MEVCRRRARHRSCCCHPLSAVTLRQLSLLVAPRAFNWPLFLIGGRSLGKIGNSSLAASQLAFHVQGSESIEVAGSWERRSFSSSQFELPYWEKPSAQERHPHCAPSLRQGNPRVWLPVWCVNLPPAKGFSLHVLCGAVPRMHPHSSHVHWSLSIKHQPCSFPSQGPNSVFEVYLVGNNSNHFIISPTSIQGKADIRVRVAVPLDFETIPRYEFSVRLHRWALWDSHSFQHDLRGTIKHLPLSCPVLEGKDGTSFSAGPVAIGQGVTV